MSAAGFQSRFCGLTVLPLLLAYSCPVAALEALALSDPDPRTRRACTVPLAKLCHLVKRAGGLASGAAASTADVQGAHKGLSQLPADGALRSLLEALVEGHWVLPLGECCCGTVLDTACCQLFQLSSRRADGI